MQIPFFSGLVQSVSNRLTRSSYNTNAQPEDRHDPIPSADDTAPTAPRTGLRKRRASPDRPSETKRLKQDPEETSFTTTTSKHCDQALQRPLQGHSEMGKPPGPNFRAQNSLGTDVRGKTSYGKRSAPWTKNGFGPMLNEDKREDSIPRASMHLNTDDEPRSKRLKTNGGLFESQYDNDPIVDDEWFKGREVIDEAPKNLRSSHRTISSQSSDVIDLSREPFTSHPFQNVDNRVGPAKDRRRKQRSQANEPSGSQDNTKAVFHASPPSNSRHLRDQKASHGTKEQPMNIDDDSQDKAVSNGQAAISTAGGEQHGEQQTSGSGELSLSNVFQPFKVGNRGNAKKVTESKLAVQTADDIANEILTKQAPTRQRTVIEVDHVAQNEPRTSVPSRRPETKPFKLPQPRHSPEVVVRGDVPKSSPSLCVTPRQGQKNRMLNGASSAKARPSLGVSEDELSGPTTQLGTVGTKRRRSISRTLATVEPTTGIPSSGQLHSSSLRGSCQTSPSDIKPTRFNNAKSGKCNVGDGPEDVREVSVNNFDMMPLQRFYTKIDHAEYSDIFIRFQPEGKYFHIAIDGSIISNPRDRGKAVFSAKHVTRIRFSEDSLLLVLEGPTSEQSDGIILLHFTDVKGFSQFYRHLEVMVSGRAKYHKMEPPQLKKIFDRQWNERTQPRKASLPMLVDDEEINAMEKRHIAREQGPARKSSVISLPYEGEEESVYSKHFPPQTQSRQEGAQSSGKQEPRETLPKSLIVQSSYTRASRRIQEKPLKSHAEDADDDAHLPAPERWSRTNALPKWDSPLEYPFAGTRRTTVEAEDIERLDEGEFLNDNLIIFGLRRLEDQYPTPLGQVHIFNTHFYSALTTKNGKKSFNFDGVKRWTKSIDLFSIPFVVVPINVDAHWFVAIICNLQNLSRTIDVEDSQEIPSEAEQPDLDIQVATPCETKLHSSPGRTQTPSQEFEQLTLASDEIPDSEEERKLQKASKESAADSASRTPGKKLPSSGRKSKKKSAPPPRKENPNDVVIITVDSFGSAHSTEVRHLKEYIVAEGLDKRALQVDKKEIRGVTAKGVPMQANFCDCGVYLLGYVAAFLKDPRGFVEKACSKEFDEHNDFADFEPSAKRAEIREDLIMLAEQQKTAKRAAKRQKLAERRLTADQSPSTSSPAKSPNANTERVRAEKKPLPNVLFPDTKVLSPTKIHRLLPDEPVATNERISTESQTQQAVPTDEDGQDDLLLEPDVAKAPSVPSIPLPDFLDGINEAANGFVDGAAMAVDRLIGSSHD